MGKHRIISFYTKICTALLLILTFNCNAKAFDVGEERIVYLTFDDGPCYIITNKLLDVLKEQNVKATFFVVGKEIEGREDILIRILDEGHSIGLHTYSHDFRKIYSSDDAFINELKKTADKVQEVAGVSPHIVRFPGGSAAQLSASLLQKLHENNFKVYDWDVNLADGINPNLSAVQLANNVKKYKSKSNRRIILGHCNYNNKNTCDALPEIIKYYRDQGYVFKPITENTQEYYFRIRKN